MNKKEMARELLTTAELQSVIRRQGFEGIHDIETCILEPGGAFSLKPKSPPADVVRHTELMQRLEALSAQVAAMQEKMAKGA